MAHVFVLHKPQLYGSVRVTIVDVAILSNYNLVEHYEFYKRVSCWYTIVKRLHVAVKSDMVGVIAKINVYPRKILSFNTE